MHIYACLCDPGYCHLYGGGAWIAYVDWCDEGDEDGSQGMTGSHIQAVHCKKKSVKIMVIFTVKLYENATNHYGHFNRF